MGFYEYYKDSQNIKQACNVETVLKLLDMLIPPVGSLVMQTHSTNPSKQYPKTKWEPWGGVSPSRCRLN
jgi:hypothetical protein